MLPADPTRLSRLPAAAYAAGPRELQMTQMHNVFHFLTKSEPLFGQIPPVRGAPLP
jgi:hypothetical protein